MDETGNKNYDFGTDVLVDILRRLPPSSLRRARLVCRRWRGAVDERTSEMQSRAVKTLISVRNTGMWTTKSSGYVVDDLSGWRLTKMWARSGNVHVIGTCNGLIGVCDDGKPGGAVTLANPVTGEGLTVPPLPRYHSSEERAPSEAYSFGYHPLTGRYKILFVPARTRSTAGWQNFVYVFTLGEASWRRVPVPADVRAIGSLVSVDGVTYWLAKNREGEGDGKVVSFDLGDERLYDSPLPVTAEQGVSVTLTVVHGRLGVAFVRDMKTDVWVLDARKWGRRYEVRLDGGERLTSPHFVHDKDYVLMTGEQTMGWQQSSVLLRRSLLVCNVLRVREPAVCSIEGYIDRAFAYVETTEPLSIYERRLG